MSCQLHALTAVVSLTGDNASLVQYMCELLTGMAALILGDSQKPQENRSLGQDLNSRLPEYEAEL
jgi:hypothetical protein